MRQRRPRLAYVTLTAEAVRKDYKEAVKWYRKAAEQGNAAGQYNLGLMYRIGRGVPKDYVAAYAWYRLAAYSGFKGGAKSRETIAKEMTLERIAEAQGLSKKLLEKIEANKAKKK
jgi:TPR repeat protein